MTRDDLLRRIRQGLSRLYGSRLDRLVLYGSMARGEDREDSDIDVLVVLNGPIAYGPELRAIIHELYPLSLASDRCISANPVARDICEARVFPLYDAVHREGFVF